MMIYTAFMIGMLGSFHCLGMCGPIAFALPVRTNNRWLKLIKYLSFNLGRVFVYAALGLIIGFVGKGFALAGLQQTISILAGAFIIISVFFIHNPLRNTFINKFSYGINEKLKSLFRFYFQKTGFLSLVILGILNGLLPCGMVYLSMLGALSTGDVLSGALFMGAFGLGTIPMMLGVSLVGNMIGMKFRSIIHKAIPLVGCIVGVLLISRGLNLNVPFINHEKSCCHAHKCH